MRLLVFALKLLGRITIGAFFIYMGLTKMFDWQSQEIEFAARLADWGFFLEKYGLDEAITQQLQSVSSLILGISAVIELFFGSLIFLGFKQFFASTMLALYFIFVAVLEHPFWEYVGVKCQLEIGLFLKDVAIVGGLLASMAPLLEAHPTGSFSPRLRMNFKEEE